MDALDIIESTPYIDATQASMFLSHAAQVCADVMAHMDAGASWFDLNIILYHPTQKPLEAYSARICDARGHIQDTLTWDFIQEHISDDLITKKVVNIFKHNQRAKDKICNLLKIHMDFKVQQGLQQSPEFWEVVQGLLTLQGYEHRLPMVQAKARYTWELHNFLEITSPYKETRSTLQALDTPVKGAELAQVHLLQAVLKSPLDYIMGDTTSFLRHSPSFPTDITTLASLYLHHKEEFKTHYLEIRRRILDRTKQETQDLAYARSFDRSYYHHIRHHTSRQGFEHAVKALYTKLYYPGLFGLKGLPSTFPTQEGVMHIFWQAILLPFDKAYSQCS
jgi:hypothetical protein